MARLVSRASNAAEVSSGVLKGEFYHPESGRSTGVAKGGSGKGYEGEYIIIYYDENGNHAAQRRLIIEKHDKFYELTWLLNDTVRSKGYGIEVNGGLSVGWKNV